VAALGYLLSVTAGRSDAQVSHTSQGPAPRKRGEPPADCHGVLTSLLLSTNNLHIARASSFLRRSTAFSAGTKQCKTQGKLPKCSVYLGHGNRYGFIMQRATQVFASSFCRAAVPAARTWDELPGCLATEEAPVGLQGAGTTSRAPSWLSCKPSFLSPTRGLHRQPHPLYFQVALTGSDNAVILLWSQSLPVLPLPPPALACPHCGSQKGTWSGEEEQQRSGESGAPSLGGDRDGGGEKEVGSQTDSCGLKTLAQAPEKQSRLLLPSGNISEIKARGAGRVFLT